MKENLINQRTFSFAVEIVNICREIQHIEKEYVLTKQLIRSATSIGANLEEAQAAVSKADFIHKNHISLKEARETRYWLRILKATKIGELSRIDCFICEAEEIIFIITKILLTAKSNPNR